jgi:Mrp family chromosome partitioning ATPase
MSLLLKALTQLKPLPVERVDERVDVRIDPPLQKAGIADSAPLREPEPFVAEDLAANWPTIDIEIDAFVEPETTSEPSEWKTATELVLEPIDELQNLVMTEIAEFDPAVEESPLFTESLIPAPKTSTLSTPALPPIDMSVEYQELCQHLLSRFRLEKHSTLIAIDAGRDSTDASWLFPFAAGITQNLAALDDNGPVPPRILIVEAAGPNCGIAQSLGIRSQVGLGEALADETKLKDAIHSTEHPQVFLLERGNARLEKLSADSIAEFWAVLLPQFDLVLVAAGPWFARYNGKTYAGVSPNSPAMLLAPLADAAILCVELNGTSQVIAAATKRQLDAMGVNLLGCVVRGDSAAA